LQSPLIEVDKDLCVGSGECVAVAPQAFLLGQDDSTATVLLGAGDVNLDLLIDAEIGCPTGAIRVERSTGGDG